MWSPDSEANREARISHILHVINNALRRSETESSDTDDQKEFEITPSDFRLYNPNVQNFLLSCPDTLLQELGSKYVYHTTHESSIPSILEHGLSGKKDGYFEDDDKAFLIRMQEQYGSPSSKKFFDSFVMAGQSNRDEGEERWSYVTPTPDEYNDRIAEKVRFVMRILLHIQTLDIPDSDLNQATELYQKLRERLVSSPRAIVLEIPLIEPHILNSIMGDLDFLSFYSDTLESLTEDLHHRAENLEVHGVISPRFLRKSREQELTPEEIDDFIQRTTLYAFDE